MKLLSTTISMLFCIGITFISWSQLPINFTPANNGTTFNTCNGFIIDSGGQGGPGYSNNESTVITICPDTPGEIISIVFNLFALDPTNTGTQQNPNMDNMSVYDGPSTASNSLGVYNTNQLQGVVIEATALNPSGCITLEFYSNSTGTGMFTASVACETPCADPQAGGVLLNGITNDSIRVCVGDTVMFQEQGSFAQPGFTLQNYMWDFMDGDTANGQMVGHAWDVPGIYNVQLFVTDDNGCSNPNLIDLQVLVGTIPDFINFPGDTSICLGESATFVADPESYEVLWNGFPGNQSVDDGCLPDTLLGVSQDIQLLQTGFAAGSTIQNANDITSICLDLEHSYMGDLVIMLECPSGQTMILHQQGGGGTQLGVPVQLDNVDCSDPSTMGTPFTYCFTPQATDTWVEWVNNQGGFGLTLPAGDYEPIDPFTNLVGCPTNGVWTLTVIDNWAADDGTLFSFGLTLDSSYYPPIQTFEPQIGNASDSSYWFNPIFQTYLSPDANTVTVTPTQSGQFTYEYYVFDDFGCEYDTTVVLTVNGNPDIFAGNDTTLCNGSGLQLNASVLGNPPNHTYEWAPPGSVSNPSVLNPTITPNGNETLIVTTYPTGHPLCSTSDTININVSATPNPGIDSTIQICSSAAPFDLFPLLGPGASVNGTWVDPNGNPATMPYDPATMPIGNYTHVVDSNGCTDQATITITEIITDITNVTTIDVACNGGADGEFTVTGNNIDEYTIDGGAPVAATSPFTVTGLVAGTYTLDVFSTEGCTATQQVTIGEPALLTLNVSGTNASCFGYCDGTVQITPVGGTGPFAYTWPAGVTGDQNGNGTNICAGLYDVTVTDANLCSAAVQFPVSEPPSVDPSVMGDILSGCYPHTVSFTNTTASNNIATTEVDFGDGSTTIVNGSAAFDHTYNAPGLYDVTVLITMTNGCEFTVTYDDLIDVYNIPNANFFVNPDFVSMLEPEVGLYSSSSADVVSWDWQIPGAAPATSTSENVLNVTYPADAPGQYPVTLTVVSNNGCIDSITKYVTIINDILLFAPNTFTPDGDEFNQTWEIHISGIDIYDFELVLFNRWGEVIWENHDPSVGWDGTYNGKVVPDGTYNWQLRCADLINDDKITFEGHVTIIR